MIITRLSMEISDRIHDILSDNFSEDNERNSRRLPNEFSRYAHEIRRAPPCGRMISFGLRELCAGGGASYMRGSLHVSLEKLSV